MSAVRRTLRVRRQNCVWVGPVRCYFTSNNCRYKHSKHSQAGRAPGSSLNWYTFFSYLSAPFLNFILSLYTSKNA